MKDDNGLENKTVETDEDSENQVIAGDSADDTDDEFEYDADGNIIIPDVIGGDAPDDQEAEDDDEDEETEDEESEDSDESEESESSDEKPVEEAEKEETKGVKEQPVKPDPKDSELESLRKKLREYESQTTDTLKKLGVKADDPLHGLAKIAAEAENKPVEDYIKERARKEQEEEAIRFLQRTKFESKMRADLAEVQAAYPETRKYKSMTEIPNFNDFGKARDAGLSPKQAYAAANPDIVRASVADAVKQQSLNETKSHLKSNVPKGSKDNSVTMSKATLAEWRGYFPHKSDKEIVNLYKQTMK